MKFDDDPYKSDMTFEYEIQASTTDYSITLVIYPVPQRQMNQDEFAEGLRQFLWKYGLACVYDEERGITRFVN